MEFDAGFMVVVRMLFSSKILIGLSFSLFLFASGSTQGLVIELPKIDDCAAAVELSSPTLDLYEFSRATHYLISRIDHRFSLAQWHYQLGVTADRLETFSGESFGITRNHVLEMLSAFRHRHSKFLAKVAKHPNTKTDVSSEFLMFALQGALVATDLELATERLTKDSSAKEFGEILKSQGLAISRALTPKDGFFSVMTDAESLEPENYLAQIHVTEMTERMLTETVKPTLKATMARQYFQNPLTEFTGVEIVCADSKENRRFARNHSYEVDATRRLHQMGVPGDIQYLYFAGTRYPLQLRFVGDQAE